MLFRLSLSLLLIVKICCSQAFAQCAPVASYPFNGNANDASGNNNNGIPGGDLANPLLTADRFGNPNSAYQFGGFYNKNWIRIPNSLSLQFNKQLTISFWFRQCTYGGMDQFGNYSADGRFVAISKAGDGLAANPGLWCWVVSNNFYKLDVQIGNKNGRNITDLNFLADIYNNCISNCEWVHCAFVVSGTTCKMYLNGRLMQQTIINPADFSTANAEDLYIGRMFGSSTVWYPFNGAIDDVNIYNCALSDANIDSLYGNYKDPLSALNNIVVDDIKTTQPACGSRTLGDVSFIIDNSNALYQFSSDGGRNYQYANDFYNLVPGIYHFRIKSACSFKDTTITIARAAHTAFSNVSICEAQTPVILGGANRYTSGTYTDTVFSNSGCDTIKITRLEVKPGQTTSVTETICKGVVFEGYKEAGRYVDTFRGVNGCDSIRTLQLSVTGPPQPYLGPDKRLCMGDSLVLPAGKFQSYLWQDRSTGDHLQVKKAGRYSVTVTNSCFSASDDIEVTEELCDVIFPTAFSPNHDGENDIFKPLHAIKTDKFHLYIYSRLGQLVYESTDYANGWDGKLNGQQQPLGVYIYRYTYEKFNTKLTGKGSFIMIR